MRAISYSLMLAAVAYLAAVSCNTTAEKEERLSKHHCGNCHLFPEPGLLDKKSWDEGVLPQMAFRMGFSNYDIQTTIAIEDLPIVLSTLPPHPVVTEQQWESIRHYFLSHAPDSLTIPDASTARISQFSTRQSRRLYQQIITHLKIDTATGILYAGSRSGELHVVSDGLTRARAIDLPSPPSHIVFDGEDILLSVMGIMDPNDQARGRILAMKKNSRKVSTILDSLQRPVYFERADMNNDGLPDFIVCAFGNYTGGLLLFEARVGMDFERHHLSTMPGARKAVIRDFNNDTKPDILALMAQGDEKVVLYLNQGDLKFQDTVLLRFSPVQGSNYFEVVDFNGDGHPDILYTNGDNGDFSSILKPYHGVKIFENDGHSNFRESWSFPMPGACQALAEDFDKDGDTDIAAISFFPDFGKHPERNFIYFENAGGYDFRPQTDTATVSGRWLVMEKGDVDADGDTDIVLGAANFGGLGATYELFSRWKEKAAPLLVLTNNLYAPGKE